MGKGENMKQTLFFLVAIFLIGTGNLCISSESLTVSDFQNLYETEDSSIIEGNQNRVYLNPSQLSYSKEGLIYLHTDNFGTCLINNIFVENGKVYTKIKDKKWPFTPFRCSQCGRTNTSTNVVCEYCGTPRPD